MTGTDTNSPVGERQPAPQPPKTSLFQVPGVIAISLYLVLLAVVIVIGVIGGVPGANHYPSFYLFFSVLLLTASGGLVLLFRWAWAAALAAVFLLGSYDLWMFTMHHEFAVLLQGILNTIFFLYLVRPEVREKLR